MLTKEVAWFCGCQAETGIWNRQSNAFFFSRSTLEAEASPGQTQCCSQGVRRLCGSVCFVGGQILFILKFSLLHGSSPSVLPLKLMSYSKTSCWNCITSLAFCLTVFLPHQGPIPVVTMFCVSHQMDTKMPYYYKQSLGFFFFSGSAYGITRHLIWSNCWILLLCWISSFGGQWHCHLWYLWPSTSRKDFFLSQSLPLSSLQVTLLCREVWVDSCAKMPSCVHEGSTEVTWTSHTCRCPCCSGSALLHWNHFQRLNVWWNLLV